MDFSSEALHSAVHLHCVFLMAFCILLLVFLNPSVSGCLLVSTEKVDQLSAYKENRILGIHFQ